MSPSDLDAAIHRARPVVAAEFVDDVMLRIRVDDSNARSRRRLAIGGGLVALAAAIAIVAIRHGPINEPRVGVAVDANVAAAPVDPVVFERGHADEAKFQRCHGCHLAGPTPVGNAVNVVAFLDLGDASAASDVRELDLLEIQLGSGVRIELELVAATPASFAALAAARQGELWSMLERIVTSFDRDVGALHQHAVDLARARRFGARGFDVGVFQQDMDGADVQIDVQRAVTDAKRRKIRTGFVVESRVFAGQDARRDMRAFAIELARARNLVPPPGKPD